MLHNMRVLAVGDHFFIMISKMSKTSCFKSRHFINIYVINKTLNGRLGTRILSSSAESISHSERFASLTRGRYFQHSKIKFVSPRGHIISSISFAFKREIFLNPLTTKCREKSLDTTSLCITRNLQWTVQRQQNFHTVVTNMFSFDLGTSLKHCTLAETTVARCWELNDRIWSRAWIV